MGEAAVPDLLTLTAAIVAAHVSNNEVPAGEIAGLIGRVHAALAALVPAAPTRKPAVAPRASVKPDYLVCLEDGKKVKLLKRHLRIHYRLTPEQYRAKWGLPPDYPMVAPNYAEKRRALAVGIRAARRVRAERGDGTAPG